MASFSLQPGQLVGQRYRLRQMIGAGGMGAVWSAADEADGREVAVKLLHPALLRDPLIIQRFFQEAELGAPLRHPFIIETYGSGRHPLPDGKEAVPYLVTELLDGEPLSDVLRRVGTLPLGPGLAMMRDVAIAADTAHRAGVLHRDLKPANVFLHRRRDGLVVPKVLDFGVSKALDPTLDVGLTTTGMLVGSPSYMSPEQALGKRDVDARSDIWSIAVMLHRALTGKSLFPITGAPGMLKHIVEKDVVLDDVAGIPAEVVAVLSRCLRRDRRERYATAAELAAALDAALSQLGLAGDLAPLLGLDTPPAADGAPALEEAGAQTSHDPPEGPTVSLSREETDSRLAVSVRPGRPRSWALPMAGVVGAALALGLALVASRAMTPASTPAAPGPTVAVTSLPTGAPAAETPPPPSTPAPSATPSAPPPAVQATPRPTAAPAPPAGRRGQPPPPPRPSDVVRKPGF
jgi:serine/threonine-protein kinase